MRLLLKTLCLYLALLPLSASADAGITSASCFVATWGRGEAQDVVSATFTWDVPSLIVAKTEKLFLRSGYRDLTQGWVWTSWLIHVQTSVELGHGITYPFYTVDWLPYRDYWSDVQQYCVQIEVTTVTGKVYVSRSPWTSASPAR